MDQSAEMSDQDMSAIRSQMDETRTALAQKLEKLEHQISDTVQGAADKISGTVHDAAATVENVKHAVQDTVLNVKTSVQDTVHAVGEALSISHHVERHPWTMMAGATAIGFVGGYLLFQKSEDRRAEERFRHLAASQGEPPTPRATYAPSYSPEPVRRDASRETMRDMRQGSGTSAFTEWLKPAASQIQSMAIGAALGLAKELVAKNIPQPMTGQVNELFDGLTSSLGGQVIRGSLLNSDSGSNRPNQPR